jgi:hypothetical protein
VRILHFDGTFDNSLIRIDSGFQATFKPFTENIYSRHPVDNRSRPAQRSISEVLAACGQALEPCLRCFEKLLESD